MKTTFIEKQKTALIKKFHVLLGQAKIDNEQKLNLLSAYGAVSSKELNVYELTELCGILDKIVNPEAIELDKLRKRLIASIAGYRQAMGATTNIDEIKAIACRAAEVKNFNRISEQRLRSLYNAFNKMRKDLQNVKALTDDKIKELKMLN